MALSSTFYKVSIEDLSQEDLEILLMFRELSPEDKSSILQALKGIEEGTKPKTIEAFDDFLARRNWKS